MKHTKFLAILLALLLASASMAACGGATTETTADTASTTTAAAETAPEETKYVADYLPDVDYNGYEYRIVEYEEWPAHVDEPSGDVVDDAIYQRNTLIEETYNISFTTTPYLFTDYGQVTTLVQTAGRAQSDDFDLATVVFRGAYQNVLEGYVPVASSLPVIDMSKPWHNQVTNDGLTIDGVALLDFTAFDMNPGGSGMIFNKNLTVDLNLGDPYQMVRDGTWTVDTVYEMAESAIMDLNGDGKMTAEDRFGFITEWDRIGFVAYFGTGNLLVDIIDGVPVASQSEKLIDAFTKCVDFLKIDGAMLDTFKEYGTAESSRVQGRELFKQGNSLFIITGTNSLTTMGDMEDDYGLVPLPKWDEAQEQYYAAFDTDIIAVPLSSSADLERVCVIKEALAVESLNITHPAYYENALQNRYVRDQDSIEMMEIITAGVINDLGQNPWWDIIRTPWQNTMQNKSTDFASAVQKNMPKSEAAIEELMELVAKLKG